MPTADKDKLHQLLDEGLNYTKKGTARPAADVFADLEEIFNIKEEKCTDSNPQN